MALIDRRKNTSLPFTRSNFHLIEGDVRNKTDVMEALPNVDVVFHLAAIASVDFSMKNPSFVNEVNIGGTLNILEESKC